MVNRPINHQALIPNHWYGVFAPNEETLKFLGKENLRYMEHYWRVSARNRKEESVNYKHRLKMLRELGLGGIHMIAATCGVLDLSERESVAGRPGLSQPVDRASERRRRGGTNFKYCGWCEYFTGDRAERGNCVLKGRCCLIPPHFNNGSGWSEAEPFYFDHECRFEWESQDFFEACCDYLRARVSSAWYHFEEAIDYAEYLALLAGTAMSKPIFPKARKSDHFRVGDEVTVFIPHRQDIYPDLEGESIVARVVGLNANAGEVKLATAFPLNDAGETVLCQKIRKPTILKCGEYDHLRQHPEYRKIWLRNAKFYVSDTAYLAIQEGLMS